ncbi:hypothetical protein LPN04_27060 [Rugamonas sp. A1-17]|nr:hypothetical protein [Rugamonas sp. A1-17]
MTRESRSGYWPASARVTDPATPGAWRIRNTPTFSALDNGHGELYGGGFYQRHKACITIISSLFGLRLIVCEGGNLRLSSAGRDADFRADRTSERWISSSCDKIAQWIILLLKQQLSLARSGLLTSLSTEFVNNPDAQAV